MLIKEIDVKTIVDQITLALDGKDEGILCNTSYETGLLGYALYYAFLAKYKDEESYLITAQNYFDKAIAALDIKNFQRMYDTDSIDAHLSHIGRFVAFTSEHKLLEIDAEDYLAKLDEILFELMKSKVSIKDFDSLSGAMAAGYYFLSRAKNGIDVEKQIAFLIQSLENCAEKDNDGDYFWKSPSLYSRIYIGISHGSSLMVSFLSTAYAFNIETETCQRIIEKAVNFIQKQHRESPYKGLFPNMIGDLIEPMQFSLCYGDLGTGYALLTAAIQLNDPSMRAFADRVLEDCLIRTKEDNLTLDASLFYGASGLVVAFDKVAKLTNDKRYEERRDYWYNQIATYNVHRNDFAGFQSRLDSENELWNVGMGWGILGIGITLMAYSTEKLPAIDQLTFIA